jgi:transcriptional regulator with XRE-family HTH domain
MISIFDKDKYKNIIQKCGFTQAQIAEKLTNIYNIKISENAVKNWTRNTKNSQGKIYQPELETIKALADMCRCSIQDFFSDAEKKREQITNEELSKDPVKYTKSVRSTFSKDIQQLLDYYMMLTDEDRTYFLEEIKQKAMHRINGN